MVVISDFSFSMIFFKYVASQSMHNGWIKVGNFYAWRGIMDWLCEARKEPKTNPRNYDLGKQRIS